MALRRDDEDGRGEEKPSGVMRSKGVEMLSLARAMTSVVMKCNGTDGL